MTIVQDKSNLPEKGSRSRLQLCVRYLRQAVLPRSRTWIKEVQGVIGELEKLNSTTEADFLAVGGNLMAFLTASRQLHADIAGLTALVSGEHVQHTFDALVPVRGFVQEMQHRSQESIRTFLTLRSAASSIHRRFSTLGKIAMSFHITAILARIETAHLAMSRLDLRNLADEVGACGDGIESRADQVLEAAVAFDTRISSTLREASAWTRSNRKSFPRCWPPWMRISRFSKSSSGTP